MFDPIQNGSVEIIYDLPCHIPPVGYLKNPQTGKYENKGVYRRHRNFDECYWEIDPRWKVYREWEKEENAQKKRNPSFIHRELHDFINDMRYYRMSGFWYYKKDVPTYITGTHFLFLCCFYMDVGLPKFRKIDRDFFLVWQYCVEDPKCFGLVECCKRRNGKCLGFNTPIRMYDGSIKMVQDIVEGDLVMGDDSTARQAYGITTGKEMMYDIIPTKGEPFSCNESHILSLKWNGVSTNTKYGWTKDGVVNISVKDYLLLKDWEKDHLTLYHCGWDAVVDSNNHKIPPYLLGVYLGDGCKLYGHISSNDHEVIYELTTFCESIGLAVKKKNKYDYIIVNPNSGFTISIDIDGITKQFSTIQSMKEYLGIPSKQNPHRYPYFIKKYNYKIENHKNNEWRERLREINVLNNKHIPKSYLIDSRDNRLELLAGLIDTDGYAVKNKNYKAQSYEITQKIKVLADQIVDLARSLGFMVNIRPKIARMKREDKSIYECEVFRITIMGDVYKIPCRVKRRKIEHSKRRVDYTRSGFKIIRKGIGDYYGFAVDGNHLFLLGDGTVTHNTLRGSSIALDMASSNEQFNVGIQSKTDDDAKKVFRKGIHSTFPKFPYFFKPKHKLSGTELRFINSKSNDEDDELNSMIDFMASSEGAYDGQKLGFSLMDEEGKTLSVNVNDRWDVIKFCHVDDEGNIIGKSFHPTTVEEMEKGGKNFMTLWNDSDQTKKGEDGMTISGLYRIFIPAHHSLKHDKYGDPLIEENEKTLLRRRQTLKSNPRRLSAEIRKNPMTIKEAFQSDASTCVFSDPISLNNRLDELKYGGANAYVIGNFEWLNAEWDTKVYFNPCPNGKWKVMYLPPEHRQNQFILRNGKKFPNNTADFRMGIDPFDYGTRQLADTERMSMGAACIKKCEGYTTDSLIDHGPAALYINRPSDPDIFYEDMLKAAFFYGCFALFERNKGNILPYFEKRGYDEFLYWIPGEKTRGIYNSSQSKAGGVNGRIAELTDNFIMHHLHTVYFQELIEDWLSFTPEDTTKYDGAMAFGFAEILDREITKKISKVSSNTVKVSDILSFIS